MSRWGDLAQKLFEGFGNSRNVRCAICHGAPMRRDGSINGYPTYVCDAGHNRTPGLDVGDRDGLMKHGRGRTDGEI